MTRKITLHSYATRPKSNEQFQRGAVVREAQPPSCPRCDVPRVSESQDMTRAFRTSREQRQCMRRIQPVPSALCGFDVVSSSTTHSFVCIRKVTAGKLAGRAPCVTRGSSPQVRGPWLSVEATTSRTSTPYNTNNQRRWRPNQQEAY